MNFTEELVILYIYVLEDDEEYILKQRFLN